MAHPLGLTINQALLLEGINPVSVRLTDSFEENQEGFPSVSYSGVSRSRLFPWTPQRCRSSRSTRCDDLMYFCSVSRVKQWRYGILIGAIQEAANTRRDPFWCLIVSYSTWDANIIYSEKYKLANDLSGSQPNTTEFERSRVRPRSVKLWKLKSKALQIVIIQLVNYGGDLVGYDKSGGQNAGTPSRFFSLVSKVWELS